MTVIIVIKYITMDASSDADPLTACKVLLMSIGRIGAMMAKMIASITDK